jgi:hypothetical protein
MLALAVHTLSQSGGEVRTPAPVASQDGGSKADSKKAEADTPPDGPWLATRAFFGTGKYKPSYAKNVGDALAELANPASPPSRPYHEGDLRAIGHLLGSDTGVAKNADCEPDRAYSVVATVADPVHTRLALFFDGQIDAIERGVEESGWTFAQQWLPWSDPFDSSEHDINVRRKQRSLEDEQESLPGILVFRNSRYHANACLFVLLAPETPTAGVAARSLTAALTIASVLSPRNSVGLMAPSFSGSFPSLEQAVSKWAPFHRDRLYANAYGGAISSQIGAAPFVGFGNVRQAGIHQFYSGTLTTRDFVDAFENLSVKYGIDATSTAYLTEDESGYGTDVVTVIGRSLSPGGKFYKFPRDISHVRNAYQQASASVTVPTQNPIPSIQLSLNDPNRGEDSIPVFAEKDTAAMQSAGLGVIAEDMKRRGIRLVYIAATNSLDELFLAQFLRQQCPNIRVAIGGDSDLLFLPAATQRSLTGILFLSTYPMFFEGDEALASNPNFARYSLLSENLQGLFNVTQLLLWHLQGQLPSGLRGYASMKPDGNAAPYPGIWLLDLTRQGFEPVDWRPAKYAEDWMEPSPNRTTFLAGELLEPFVSSGWYVTSRITAIGIISACVIFFLVGHTNKIVWPVWAGPRDETAVRFPFFAWACVFLSCVPWILGLPAAFEWSQAPNGQDFTVILLGIAFVFPIGLLLRVAYLRRCDKRETSSWYKQPLIVCAGPFYLLILIVWWNSCYGTDSGSEMFRWRALQLYSSSSPALPLWLICNAIVVGFMAGFYRRSDTGNTGPHLTPSAHGGIKAFAVCYHKVNYLVAGTFQWTRLVTCALVTGVSVMLLWQQLPAFEMRGYNVCLEILVFALIWGLAGLAHDGCLIWFNLRRILGMVESVPLRGFIAHAARALPRRHVWTFWKPAPQQALGVRMCEALHNRERVMGSRVDSKVKDGAKQLADDFLKLFRRRFAGNPDMSESAVYYARTEYEGLAASTAHAFYQTLWQRWLQSEISESTGGDLEDESNKDAEHFACDFVALQCCNYLTHVVRRTQQIVWNISFLLVLLIVVMNSYAAQGPVSIGRYIVVLFVASGGVVVYVFAGMERNWVLSTISRTTPGELNVEFWLHLAALGILPLIAIVVHLFPEVATFLYSWVAPGVESAK